MAPVSASLVAGAALLAGLAFSATEYLGATGAHPVDPARQAAAELELADLAPAVGGLQRRTAEYRDGELLNARLHVTQETAGLWTDSARKGELDVVYRSMPTASTTLSDDHWLPTAHRPLVRTLPVRERRSSVAGVDLRGSRLLALFSESDINRGLLNGRLPDLLPGGFLGLATNTFHLDASADAVDGDQTVRTLAVAGRELPDDGASLFSLLAGEPANSRLPANASADLHAALDAERARRAARRQLAWTLLASAAASAAAYLLAAGVTK